MLANRLLQTKGIDTDEAIKQAGYKSWNVYAKVPFGNVASVVEYLGRYTHKVAITKHRILRSTETDITFRYKDYSDASKQKGDDLKHCRIFAQV